MVAGRRVASYVRAGPACVNAFCGSRRWRALVEFDSARPRFDPRKRGREGQYSRNPTDGGCVLSGADLYTEAPMSNPRFDHDRGISAIRTCCGVIPTFATRPAPR